MTGEPTEEVAVNGDDWTAGTEVRLPRSLVVSFVVSISVLVLVGILGIVVTNRRAADNAEATRVTARCLLLQLLEHRARSHTFHEAAATVGGFADYDRALPASSAPPDISAIERELTDACSGIVTDELLSPPQVTTTTTTAPPPPQAVVVVPGPPGPAGARGDEGRPGPAGPSAPTSTVSPTTTTTAATTTTTTRPRLLPPLTLPISSSGDPYAGGIGSLLAPFLVAVALSALWGWATLRTRRASRPGPEDRP